MAAIQTHKRIPLRDRNGLIRAYAKVDEADYGRVSTFSWHLAKDEHRNYVIRCEYLGMKAGKVMARTVRLHRFILNADDGVVVDHINGDGLDCRRSNMRLCSQEENSRNKRHRKTGSSKFKGVSWDKKRRRWYAQINHDGRNSYLGRFEDEEKAAVAYNNAALKYFGSFANINSGIV